MKARSRTATYAKVAAGMVALLLFILSTAVRTAPLADISREEPFQLENFAKATTEITVEQPGEIVATARWAPEKAGLSLILFGPGKMNYYERCEGASPLTLSYTVTESDTTDGNAWRLKLINQSGESVEGVLYIHYPGPETAEPEVLQ